MKWSKEQKKHWDETLSAKISFEDAERKQKNSITWLIVYTTTVLAGYILLKASKLSQLGFIDFVALTGCILAGIVIFGIATMLYGYFYDSQMRAMDCYVTEHDYTIIILVSYLATALIMIFPCGILWILIEHIKPLHAWLVVPTYNILRYQGIRLAGGILAVIPYALLFHRYRKNKKLASYYGELYRRLEAE